MFLLTLAYGAEVPIIIGAITAIAGTGASYYSAQQQNKKADKAAEAQQMAVQVQTKQLKDQAGLEKIKRLREMASIEGRIKVNAAGAGLATTGSFDQLLGQAAGDATENLSILDQNVRNQQQAISSGAQVNLASLDMQRRSPALDAFAGGLSGASTGLSIGQGVRNLTPPK